ncbi:hypothetical protein L1049_017680 [Liquidambar formosana]|uniref:RING-type domain-containing protein n=1 Tax=Liquidambar formosana TaxID=63359 RepID=A0AAP0S194_LIQFO
MVLDFDLNGPPPGEDRASQTSVIVCPQELQDEEHVQSLQQAIVDIEAIDDDIVISSPKRFYEARRNREVIVVNDEDTCLYNGQSVTELTELTICLPVCCNKHRRITQTQKDTNWELYKSLEVGDKTKTKNVPVPPEFPPSVPLPKASTFSCPVCMGQLIEETSTKCGHIFCEKCIKTAIASQSKCPTCRQKLTMRDTIRIYLPATS